MTGQKQLRYQIILTVLGALWVAGACYWISSRYYFRVCDDAYISFRYARNLVAGRGLVFNQGEYVEGYTNFLWVLVLALVHAAAKLVDFSPVRLAVSLSVIISLVNIFLVYLVSKGIFKTRGFLALVPPLLLAADNIFLVNAVMGLEGPLLQCFLLTGLLFLEKDSLTWSSQVSFGLVGAALVMTRPDAGIISCVLFGAYFFQFRNKCGTSAAVRGILLPLIAAALPLLIWSAWKMSYYGQILPNTYYLKLDARGYETIRRGLPYLQQFLRDELYLPLLIIPAFFLCRNFILRVFSLIFLAQAAYAVYIGGDFYPFSRFLLVVIPAGYLAAVAVADYLLELRPVSNLEKKTYVAAVVAAVVVALYGIRTGPFAREVVPFGRLHEARARLGQWLKKIGEPSDRLLYKAIGSLGYYSNLRIIDMFGVIDPEIAVGHRPSFGRPGHEKLMTLQEALGRNPTIIPWGTMRGEVRDWSSYGFFFYTDWPRKLSRFQDQIGPGIWIKDDLAAAGMKGTDIFDFESEGVQGWAALPESDPWTGPAPGKKLKGVDLFHGNGYLSTFDPVRGDRAVIKLKSPSFRLTGDFLCMLVAGGRDSERLKVEVRVGDEKIARTTGSDTDYFGRRCFDVMKWKGQKARIRVVDGSQNAGGHIMVDNVTDYGYPSSPPAVASTSVPFPSSPPL